MTIPICDPKVAGHIQSRTPAEQEIIAALREVLFAAQPNIEEAMK